MDGYDEYFGHNGRIVDSSTGASGRTEGTHLGLRLNERFGLQPARPTCGGVRAKPNSQCVTSCVPMFAAPPSMCAAMRYAARPCAVR
jgi:hypothetical protein